MAYTQEQLVTLALKQMGVIGAGQSASAEDGADIKSYIPTVMSDLATRNIWAWGDPDTTPDEAALHIADLLGYAAAPAFGLQRDEAKRLLSESRLRRLNAEVLSGQPLRVDYF